MKRLICIPGGKLQFEEVENPSISGVGVVTKTAYSAISPGTEGDWVIKQRQADSKKGSPMKLGYSTAGIALEKHKDIDFVEVGDKVACVGCSIEQYRESIPKLANLEVDALLPGHFGFCLNGGQRHINKAIESFKSLSLPTSI